MGRHLGPEAARNSERRQREGIYERFLSGDAVLDIGYRGGDPKSDPITDRAIGIDLDYPGYDGQTLPFSDNSQDAVFVSHVLEHIENWAYALAEWYRVLRIGGYLIIAVPHRDLYERKSSPPSRFNADHKRFYTPALLLGEVEEALPIGGYRIRSLKDVDENFDYTVPPERHAVGCYEIELVLEKIATPHYAELLRESPVVENIIAIYATLVWDATMALRLGRDADLKQIREFLSSLPLPPFALLARRLEDLAPYGNRPLRHELQSILKDAIERAPFDQDWYLETYADVAEWVKTDPVACPRSHFIVHGYFEGRSPSLEASLFLRPSGR